MSSCPDCGRPLPERGDCPHCATQAPPRTAATLSGEPPPASSTPLPAGGRIAHFMLLRELGAGGMGVVYLARDEKMKRDVALKVMARAHLSETAGKRFAQEAWIAGRLVNPTLAGASMPGGARGWQYVSSDSAEGGDRAGAR